MTNRVDINNLLTEMRQLKSQAQAFQRPQGIAELDRSSGKGLQGVNKSEEVPSFGDMLEQAVNSVNKVQKNSAEMAKAYETGDPNVDITDVMVASQKASVSFQSMVQVRNKLIEAYRDVMNMPV